MNIFMLLLGLMATMLSATQPLTSVETVGSGHLPVVMADAKGTFHLVYGQDSTIYYATTNNPSSTFTKPVAVAILPNLVAGAKRGPQVVVAGQYVVITAVDRMGDIYAYSLDRLKGKWSSAVRVNDRPAVAKEGFQAIAGTSEGVVHSVWLDLRGNNHNKIVGSTSHDGGRSWSPNQIIYQSPDGSVCECCKVSIAAQGNDVYIQFRNWLGGSRDLYLAHSTDGGLTYPSPQKLGLGTWKLNGCPMDGGAVVLSSIGQPVTAWRRENTLYTCIPGHAESSIGTGKNITVAAGNKGAVYAWDEENAVWVKPVNGPTVAMGKGQMPSLAVTGQTALCAWEVNGQILVATVKLNSQ